MVLSDRLEMILSLVKPGSYPADIGTDHGFVPVELVRRGTARGAIAMDVRTGPLERAQEHIRMAGLSDRIDIRLSDGFSALKAGEADSAIIAGMGGGLMARILADGKDVVDSLRFLVLSPHSEAFRVRQCLREFGFVIEEEKMIREDGKFYPGIRAVKHPEHLDLPPLFETGFEERTMEDAYGPVLLRKRDPVLKEYLLWRDRIVKGILSGLTQEGEGAAIRREELEAESRQIWKALTLFGLGYPENKGE